MKSQLTKLVLLASAMCSLVGCLDESKIQSTVVTYDVRKIIENPDLTPEQKSEQLALVGEQLSTPVGFMYANEVLDESLKLNANNKRAQLYKSLTAPAMALKGAITRIKPVSIKFSRNVQEGVLNFEDIVAANPSVDAFMRAPVRTDDGERQIQFLVEDILVAQNRLRVFFKENKSLELELYPNRPKLDLARILAECKVNATEPIGSFHGKYTVDTCRGLDATKFSIDMGDIEALQHMAAGQVIASILATAYDATGGAKFERAMSRNKYSAQGSIAMLQQLNEFGKLRGGNMLVLIHAMGSDIYAGAKWMQQWQQQLCPAGWEKNNRPGMLFRKGFCTSDHPEARRGTMDSTFAIVAAALGGQSVDAFVHQGKVNVTELANPDQYHEYNTKVNILAPVTNPVADLKSILPTRFDKCGRANNLGDQTVAGLFPTRDGETVAKKLNIIHEECQ